MKIPFFRRKPRHDGEDGDALTRLIALLSTPEDRAAVLAETLLARDAPQDYFDRFADALYQRGIEDVHEVDFWLALTDALEKTGNLRESDWKTEGGEIAYILQTLAAKRGLTLTDDACRALTTRQGYDSIEALATDIRAIVQPIGLTAVYLDIDSDSYPLCLIPNAQVAQARALARSLDRRIILL